MVPWRDSMELAEFMEAGSNVFACEMPLDAVKMLLPLDMVRDWLLWLLLLLLVPMNCCTFSSASSNAANAPW